MAAGESAFPHLPPDIARTRPRGGRVWGPRGAFLHDRRTSLRLTGDLPRYFRQGAVGAVRVADSSQILRHRRQRYCGCGAVSDRHAVEHGV